MRVLDMLAVGALGLRARPTRTILTAVGIALGIAAVVSIVGISASSEADAQAQVDEFGTNFLIVTPGLGIAEEAELSSTATEMIGRIGPVTSSASVTVVNGARPRRNEFINDKVVRKLVAQDGSVKAPIHGWLSKWTGKSVYTSSNY